MMIMIVDFVRIEKGTVMAKLILFKIRIICFEDFSTFRKELITLFFKVEK
jgi:hypothetical protein